MRTIAFIPAALLAASFTVGASALADSPAAISTASAAAVDIGALNPAFQLSPDQYARRVSEGDRAAAKHQSEQSLTKDYVQHVREATGQSAALCFADIYAGSLHGFNVLTTAYEKAAQGQLIAVPDTVQQHGTFYRTANFTVVLSSIARATAKNYRGGKAAPASKAASADDVTATGFTLTDDTGAILHPLSIAPAEVTSGKVTVKYSEFATQSTDGVLDGAFPIQPDSASFHAPAPESPLGVDGNGEPPNGGRADVDYGAEGEFPQVAAAEFDKFVKVPYYTSRYSVEFPLFDDKGQPLITDKAKSLTLHFVTLSGEQTVTYNLTKSPR